MYSLRVELNHTTVSIDQNGGPREDNMILTHVLGLHFHWATKTPGETDDYVHGLLWRPEKFIDGSIRATYQALDQDVNESLKVIPSPPPIADLLSDKVCDGQHRSEAALNAITVLCTAPCNPGTSKPCAGSHGFRDASVFRFIPAWHSCPRPLPADLAS